MQRQNILNLPPSQHPAVVDYLYSHYRSGQQQSGNQRLALLCDVLLRQLVQHDTELRLQRQWLEIAAHNASLTGNADVRNRILQQLAGKQLSDDELMSVAETMTQISLTPASSRATQTPEVNAVQTAFWQKVLSNSAQGSETWLEASLQLAGFAALKGDIATATRQLGVVQTLYPDWGSPERRARAQKLVSKLAP